MLVLVDSFLRWKEWFFMIHFFRLHLYLGFIYFYYLQGGGQRNKMFGKFMHLPFQNELLCSHRLWPRIADYMAHGTQSIQKVCGNHTSVDFTFVWSWHKLSKEETSGPVSFLFYKMENTDFENLKLRWSDMTFKVCKCGLFLVKYLLVFINQTCNVCNRFFLDV